MTTNPPERLESKPYKGPKSYEVEDSELFFGRDREADQLIARILSSRLTLLHAQSGAGKTSLLNARVIPGLETRGWGAYRILPQNDPVMSVRAETLRYVLPPPEAERLAIVRALDALGSGDLALTLEALLARYDNLKPRKGLKRALVAPLEVALPNAVGAIAEAGSVTPVFCRLLRSTIEIETFAEHLNAVCAQSEPQFSSPLINGRTRVGEILDLLSDPAYKEAYANLIEEMNVPVNDLSVFFEHLVEIYGRRRTRFALVLILDQFEEMFTRFIDPGPTVREMATKLPNWRLRYEFFNQIERLYGAPVTPEGENAVADSLIVNFPKSALPLRYVISMRDEYIAQLDPLRQFVWDLDNNSYHLSLLDRNQAEDAIRKPAEEFGYGYSTECYTEIIDQLTKEDRFVEPSHLQLVCERLWNEEGKKMAGQIAEVGDENTRNQIARDTFLNLEGAKGILGDFFRDYLKNLDTEEERLETLEMLEMLVTASGTRNIVERDVIVRMPFRDEERRRRLIENLVNRTIVRTERRLGGNFVEITHEFLIGPVLESLRDELGKDPRYTQLRWALSALERLYRGSLMGAAFKSLLSAREFFTLHQRREQIKWNEWGAELMFRSALCFTDQGEIDDYRSVLKFWGFQIEHPDQMADADRQGREFDQGEILELREFRELNSQRDNLILSPEKIAVALRSALTWAIDDEREEVAYWARRAKHDVN
jgi:conflict system STAND superfamily ATPase